MSLDLGLQVISAKMREKEIKDWRREKKPDSCTRFEIYDKSAVLIFAIGAKGGLERRQ
jgi:hypothetical protein